MELPNLNGVTHAVKINEEIIDLTMEEGSGSEEKSFEAEIKQKIAFYQNNWNNFVTAKQIEDLQTLKAGVMNIIQNANEEEILFQFIGFNEELERICHHFQQKIQANHPPVFQFQQNGEKKDESEEESSEYENWEEKKDEEAELSSSEDETPSEEYREEISAPFGASEADINHAKEILAILEGSPYSLDVVLCVLRHSEVTTTETIVDLLSKGINVEEWKEKDKIFETPVPKQECILCFDELDVTEMFTLDCIPESHRFCFECIKRLVTIAIDQEGTAPRCPHKDSQGKSCNHQLSEKEVAQICGFGTIWDKYKRQMLRTGLMSMSGCVGCPTIGCENWLIIEAEPGERIRCYCSACNNAFCSACRELYHFNTSCEDAKLVAIRWSQWNAKERQDYKNKEEKQALLSRKLVLKARMEEYKKDEEWKTNHLKHCPQCKRLIEKLSGCDSMVCGRNYHGGDVQDGCGASFLWSTAPGYKSNFDFSHFAAVNANSIDESDKKYGKLDHGEYCICDSCSKQIFGVRFKCIHCPCFNLCDECEPKSLHNQQHVFNVLTKPEHMTDEELLEIQRKREQELREANEEIIRAAMPRPKPVIVTPPPPAVPLIQQPVVLNLPNTRKKKTGIKRLLSAIKKS